MKQDIKKVTSKEITRRVYEKCDYKKEIVEKVINVFIEELRSAIINECHVQINNCFAFRHKWKKERRSGNLGKEKIITIPAHMVVVPTMSRGITITVRDNHKDEDKDNTMSLRDLPLGDFE